MPRLRVWCDEASYAHWEQESASIPTTTTAFERLRDSGKLSTVGYPSAAHAAGNKTGDAEPKFAGTFGPRPNR